MSRKVRSIGPAPYFRDPLSATYFRQLGFDAVLGGDELWLQGVDLPPVWQWFDLAQPVHGDKVARLFCQCGKGPIGLVWRVWQPGAETVAKVTYIHRAKSGMVERQAILHVNIDGCRHGPLLLHPADQLEAHCRLHNVALPGATVVDLVRRQGGWGHDTPAEPPPPRRVVLYPVSMTPG